MVPEELLTRCIAAVETGENPTQVAARYPEYAAELEPLPQAVALLRATPKPRMSGTGFVAGRRAIAEEAARRAAQLKAEQAENASASQGAPQAPLQDNEQG